ncbi:MAG: putative diacylglycerol acyltransferase, partial [Actinomycetia bacterium]|nr:putative diacylglycerol acyltransferase [Actinomycetes bacterium]
MAKRVRFDRRMSDHEALMWALEDDPVLRSSFANITITDQPVDIVRLRARMATAVQRVPRLRQRVVEPPGYGSPRWDDDPLFDLDFHVRHVSLPAPGTERQLLDLAALVSTDPFDRARPLWQFLVVDGLADGRGAFIQKLHHTIADGEGGVRLSAQFLDLERDAVASMFGDPDDEDVDEQRSGFSAVDALRRPFDLARRAMAETVVTVANPFGAPARAGEVIEAGRSVLRQVAVTDPACSPLWADRSLRRRLEILSLPLDRVKAAAEQLGGKVNDLFVAGAVGAAGAYHRARGVEVEHLRMAMPISTRTADNDGSNAFTPTRMLVPTDIADPAELFRAVQVAIAGVRAEPGLSFAPSLAGLLHNLPAQVLLKAARHQVGTVDFTTSNVRGAPFDLYVAGAQILGNHPLGPMAGTAFNLTTMSMGGRLDMGLLVDLAAVGDPELLRDSL